MSHHEEKKTTTSDEVAAEGNNCRGGPGIPGGAPEEGIIFALVDIGGIPPIIPGIGRILKV